MLPADATTRCLRRQKEEGRRQKVEGRRQKAEGRRQKVEGRRRYIHTCVHENFCSRETLVVDSPQSHGAS